MKALPVAIAAMVIAFLLVSSAQAQELSTVAEFDPSLGELPEAVAVNGAGDLFLTMQSGEIKKVTPEGAASTFAMLPSPGEEGFVTGLAFDEAGDLFVLLGSFVPETHGIWRIDPDGNAELFAAMDTNGLPNWPAFNAAGDLFVSDSFVGRIWKVTPDGDVSVWFEDPLLQGASEPPPPLPFSVGANGIAFDEEQANLYVANTNFGRIVRVPVNSDGTPGGPEVFFEDADLLDGADGIAFDDQGRLYVTTLIQNRIVRLSPDGAPTTLLEGDPLQNPSTLAFGAGDHASQLFITNFAALVALGIQEGTPAPALLSMETDASGILVQEPEPTATPEATATTAPALPDTGTGPTPTSDTAWWQLGVLASAGFIFVGMMAWRWRFG